MQDPSLYFLVLEPFALLACAFAGTPRPSVCSVVRTAGLTAGTLGTPVESPPPALSLLRTHSAPASGRLLASRATGSWLSPPCTAVRAVRGCKLVYALSEDLARVAFLLVATVLYPSTKGKICQTLKQLAFGLQSALQICSLSLELTLAFSEVSPARH